MADAPTPAAVASPAAPVSWPAWTLVLAAAALLATATQKALPGGLPLTLADPLLAAAFAGVLLVLWRQRLTVPVPWPVLGFLALYVLSNLVSRSGRPGAIESMQRVEQLLCGYLVLHVLLSERPSWVPRLVAVALAVNVLAALVQLSANGYGPTLPGTKSVTGLFHSRMCLSFFLALGLAWVVPFGFRWADRPARCAALAVGVAVTLGFVLHGHVLVLTILALALLGLLHSSRAFLTVAGGVLLLLVWLGVGPSAAARRAGLADSVSPFRADGQVHKVYAEAVAAVRMANEHRWTGIGAGRYQGSINTYYGELPSVNVQDIEHDTQPGLGILLGTVGYPATLAWVLTLLAALALAVQRHVRTDGSRPAYLGAAGVLGLTVLGTGLTDPLVRGISGLVALALAAAFAPLPADSPAALPQGPVRRLGCRGVVLACVLLGALGVAVAVLPQAPQAVSGRAGRAETTPDTPATPAAPGAAATTPATPAAPAPAAANFASDADFFEILNPPDAKTLAPPMESAKDPSAAKGVILRIIDEKGKPPEGAEPDMTYGGAQYEVEVPKNVKCKVWMRVWWEGSCGNSLFFRLDTEKPLVLGNDGTYNAWHWLAVPESVNLKQGKSALYVLNREDGIRVDQILLTGDAEYVPQGIEEE